MVTYLKQWFAPPVFEDEEKTRRAGLLSTAINAMTIGCAAGVLGVFIGSTNLTVSGMMISLLFFFQVFRWMMKRGWIRMAGFLFAISISLAVSASLAVLGTVRTPGVAILVLSILAAEILSGGRAAVGMILLNSVLVGVLIIAERAGDLPDSSGTVGFTQWVILTATFGVAGAFLHLSTRMVNQALALARFELAERHRIEAELEASKNHFRALIENIAEIVALLDAQAKILYASPAIETTLGYTPDELIGSSGIDLIHPEDLNKILPCIQGMIEKSNGEVSAEFRLRHKNGDWRWVSGMGKNALADPTIEAIIINYRDITERKLAEDTVRANEARFRSILTAIPDLVFISDAQGTYHDFFTVHEERLGLPREQIIGRTIHDIFPPEIAQRFQQKLDEAAATSEVIEYEYDLAGPETHNWFQARAVAYETPQGQFIVWLARDINVQKQAKAEILKLNAELEQRVKDRTAALQESEERFRMLFEESPDAIWIIEPHEGTGSGRILDCNEAACRMTGYTREELIGAEDSLINAGPDVPDYLEKLRQGRHLTFEDLNRRKDGTIYPIEVSTSLLTLRGKQIILGVDRDITERKRAEDELRQANEAMLAVNQELEAFSYSVSHDLRAPLRAIDGFSTMLMEMYAPQLDEQGQRYVANVQQAAQRMGTLIDDLLKLSRVSRKEFHREACSLSHIAEEILQALQTQTPERHATIRIQPDLTGSGDPSLLRVMLENLLGNAWKFSGKQPHAEISFGMSIQAKGKVYFVRDNGAGFDMAYADRLFGAFQRLHRYEEFEGTGIGLATVQRIVHRHGGQIWAEAAVEQGASFYFTLPD
ncbi:MAG: PAS domain S-box protein [Anaerolineales bacterium]|nr:PAS domain S-box protein [Anaerolineales bacterium]